MKNSDINLVEIGERMKQVRARLRRTQASMASDLGISLSHYSKLEVGIGGMSHGLIYTFCRTFDIDQDWFVYGKGPEPVNIAVPFDKKNGAPGAAGQIAAIDARLELIIDLAYKEKVVKLADQISQATQIPRNRAMALLIKELLAHPEKIEE